MTPKSFFLSPEIHEYLVAHGLPPDELQQELIRETAALGDIARMQIAPEQGAFMTVLARTIGARRAIEVGTFTGYSSLCIARGLSDDGSLLACDISDEWTKIAQRYWERAGVADRIDLRVGPAAETLRSLPIDPVYDLAFIDADKTGYVTYYEEILRRLRPSGVVLVDNVLWSGRVADSTTHDSDTDALREFNDQLAADDRVDTVMLPISDGLTMARKR